MKEVMKSSHSVLRRRLSENEELHPILLDSFIQGSYRRATAVRPKGDKRSDVDIIVVTKLHEDEYSPRDALDLFEPFLEKHYQGKWRRQGRSFGIELSNVDLDVVPTSAPDEQEYGILMSDSVLSENNIVEDRDWRLHKSWLALTNRSGFSAIEMLKEAAQNKEWQSKPLRIPDREADVWDDTHPLEQIRYTRDKNFLCNGHFVNVVKSLKWWRLVNYTEPTHPKGFPLERLIGEHCPDAIDSVAEGIVETLESIESSYLALVQAGGKPKLPDYGVPSHDVFHKITAEDFGVFYNQVKIGADLSRRAFDSDDRYESGKLWGELLGSKFPDPPDNGSGKTAGFTPPAESAAPGSQRFAE